MHETDDFDRELERWLIEEVFPASEEFKAHPERGLTIDQVRAHIAEFHRQAVEANEPPGAPEKPRR